MTPRVIRFSGAEIIPVRGVGSLLPGSKPRYRAVVDGKSYRCEVGAWAIWIPSLGVKLLHACDGHVHCERASAPTRGSVAAGASTTTGKYTLAEWRATYDKPVERRAAELYVATERLHRAGVGPAALGLCTTDTFTFLGRHEAQGTAGIVTEDARRLPKRQDATESEVIAAGVVPDKILSCVRQQVNGYVVDLNSCVGAYPADAEEAVTRIEALLQQASG